MPKKTFIRLKTMFTVTVETTFNASHQLTMPDNQKEPLHAHDWQLRVAVSAEKLDQMGLVIDFHDLKAAIDTVTSNLAGKKLEDLPCFQTQNASAETLARHIYDQLKKTIKGDVKLDYVEIMEAQGCWARYNQ